jgi:hypothetical protein
MVSPRTSPVATLRLPKKARGPSPIPEMDVNVTAATPPIEEATLPNTDNMQSPLWLSEGQADLRNFVSSAPSSPGIHEENRGGPMDEAWHSREPTRVQGARPDSGVGGLGVETHVTTVANPRLDPIKSETSLAAGITSGLNVSASIGAAGETENEKRPSTGIFGWLKKRVPKKHSTEMSGSAAFEEVWEEHHSDDGKPKEPETDVLEVWFAGCHSGELLLSCRDVPALTRIVDVGGGEELNTTKYSLSNISLRW